MNKFKSLSLAWQVAAAGIAAIGVLLALALGLVSAMIWRGDHHHAAKSLQEATEAVSRVIDSYDETARANTDRIFSVFKAAYSSKFTLQETKDAEGKPRSILSHGGMPLIADFSEVDRFSEMTGGVATVFARVGDDFERITTSLKNAEGNRAMGTLLGKQHPAYQAMIDGKPYVGRAVLFGRPYMTKYEPIVEAGRSIAILFIGFDMTETLNSLRKTMQLQRPYGTGVLYAIDLRDGANLGTVFGFDQPRKLDANDAAAGAFLKALQAAGDRGELESSWSSAEMKVAADERDLVFTKNKTWNWAIVAEVPEADMLAATKRTLATLWIAVTLAVGALAVVLVWVSQRMISRPLGDLTAALSYLADGDLTHSFATQRRDEIGRLTQAMESFRLKLVSSIGAVSQSSDSIRMASSEIATGNQDLSSRTEQQASSLQETAASMEQLTGTVKQNASAAEQANQLASGASEVAERGGQVVGQVVQTMEGITQASRKIAEIITVVDGIAFQTNILALNAAVEAARAGEQGRGFAVVAGEVRNLAQRSAQAAREIKTLISASLEQVESGSRQVGEAGRTMDEIVAQVKRVSSLIGEITHATLEQSSGIGQVNQAVTQLDQVTQQNAALVEQSAAAAESLKEQAGRLAEAVSIFKLGQQTIAKAQASSRAAVQEEAAV